MLFGIPIAHLAVAFAVASSVTAIELITSRYPRTARFALSSTWFYVYFLVYGVLAAAGLALLPCSAPQVSTGGIGASNPWTQAALIGFSVKAILHIRIFAVSTGPGQSFPVGLESFVQLFEPWLLRTIELDHYSAQSKFIAPRAAAYPHVDDARTQSKNNPPPGLSPAEKAVFEADIDQANTVGPGDRRLPEIFRDRADRKHVPVARPTAETSDIRAAWRQTRLSASRTGP